MGELDSSVDAVDPTEEVEEKVLEGVGESEEEGH